MNFIKGSLKGRGGVGSYVSVFLLAFFSFMAAQLFCEVIAQSQFGFSLANPSQKGMENVFLTLMLIPFSVFFIVLIALTKSIHKQSILTTFTARKKIDFKRILTSFSIWGGILGLFVLYNLFFGENLSWNYNSASIGGLLLISFLLIPIQIMAEELLFRSYLLQGFYKGFKNTLVSVILSGVLFGLIHIGNPEVSKIGYEIIFYYILSGVFLGVITVMDDGMELSIGYHAANNIFGALIVTNEFQAFQTDAIFMDSTPPAFGWDSWLTILIIQPLLIFIFSKIYKWPSWRKKMLS